MARRSSGKGEEERRDGEGGSSGLRTHPWKDGGAGTARAQQCAAASGWPEARGGMAGGAGTARKEAAALEGNFGSLTASY